MKKLLILAIASISLAGCVNESVIESYRAYQNSVGREYEEYLNAGKRPDGSEFTEAELISRGLNLSTARDLIKAYDNEDD